MFFRRRPSVQIEWLRASRAAECARLHASAFRRGWEEGEFVALLNDANIAADAAIDAERSALLAFIISRRAADEAEILSIAVAERFRGAGVGARLLQEHMEKLALDGVSALYLEVEAGNAPALALYKRAGFEKVGERRGYYPTADGPAAMALIMRRSLP